MRYGEHKSAISATALLAICRDYDTSDRGEYKRRLRECSPIEAMAIWRAVNLVDTMRINRLIGR